MKTNIYRVLAVIGTIMALILLGAGVYLICTPAVETVEISTVSPTTEPTETTTETSRVVPTPVTTLTPAATTTPTPVATATPMPIATATPEPEHALLLHQINVGCSNAYLVQFNGYNIVIDSGDKYSHVRKNVQEYLKSASSDFKVDFYFATHWHRDHVTNIDMVLNNFGKSETIVYGPSTLPSSDIVKKIGKTEYRQLVVGDILEIPGGLTIYCVGPFQIDDGGNVNRDSLNLVFCYKDFKAMICGDYVRNEVLEGFEQLVSNVDILQFPHHGLSSGESNFSVSKKVLQTINPKTVLVPANSAGPARKFLKKCGIESNVHTNQSGNVAIITYGNGYDVHTDVAPGDFKSLAAE